MTSGAALGDHILESLGLSERFAAGGERMREPIPAIVLGGTGYVAGELLRLLAAHPRLDLAAVASDSQPDTPVAQFFPHLQPVLPHLRFVGHDEIVEYVAANPVTAVLSAAPHGVSATLIDRLLTAAESAGTQPRVVDISADFRYTTAAAYERVYKHGHGAPARIAEFTCAVPEHATGLGTPHVAHPGCFATAVLLASVPLLALGLVEPRLFVTGITGSTGSGRQPTPGTHHPQRHSDLYAYGALAHRHAPEIAALAAAASGVEARIRVRAALRSVRARHPRHGAGRGERADLDGLSCCRRSPRATSNRRSCTSAPSRHASRTSPAATSRVCRASPPATRSR